MNYLSAAIKFDQSYFSIPIIESNEKLIDVESVLASQCQVVFNRDLTSTGQERLFVLRQSLVTPLLLAAQEFNSLGYQLRLECCYRSLADQRQMYEQSVIDTIKQYPGLSRDEIIQIAGILLASTPNTAAHLSGCAVDVTLLTLDNQTVDFGAQYLQSGERSVTDFPNLTEEIKNNRILLCSVMEKYGFANYPYEFWHFCQGDKIEARVHGKNHAIYGPAIFDHETQITTPVANADQAFNIEHLFL